jgi:tetratricopeptide (TPR) repeat protein
MNSSLESPPDRASTIRNSLNHAVSLFSSGRTSEALATVTQLLEQDSTNVAALNIAGACSHSLGQLKEAEDYWRRALTQNPNDADVNSNLGILLNEMKRFPEAEAAYRRALEIRPDHVKAHANLRSLLYEAKRFPEAEALYRQASAVWPDDASLHYNLGNLLYKARRFPEAEAAYRQALAIRPDDAEAHNNLANVLYETKRFPEAEAAYRQALAARPGYASAHHNLGNLLHETKRFAEAEAAYRQALAIHPDYFEAHISLGNQLCKEKHFPEAEACYRRALKIRPDHPNAHANLGIVLKEIRRFPEAEAACQRALEIRPDYVEAHANLGNLFMEVKRFPEAEAAYRRALAIQPERAETRSKLGNVLYETKRFAEAEAAYRQALSQPDYVDARWNLGLLLLHTGRFAEGWPLYEARYDEKNGAACVRKPAVGYPQWQGESLDGKSIVVHCELGFGDSIQFVRYLPLLKAMGTRRITVICGQPLRALVESIDGVNTVLTPAEMASVPAHDYWAFLLSLPLHFATTLDSMPNAIPYVRPAADRIHAWEARLPAPGLRIGLVWKGNPRHQNDRNRSLPSLAALAPLWNVPGAHFVSLQKGQGEDEATTPPPGQPLIHLGTDINDFADSAAIIAQLDLVICVDTAIGHLAGALGKPCWILLPRTGTDWRWLEERTDSPWYPGTARLFRQGDQDDWADTVLQVAEALHHFATATGSTAR